MSGRTDESASQAAVLLGTAMAFISVAVGIAFGVAWGFATFGAYLLALAVVLVASGGGR